jgi:TRAP transporter TAXI family solute receptor
MKKFLLSVVCFVIGAAAFSGGTQDSRKTAADANDPFGKSIVVGGGSAGGTGTITAAAWIERIKQVHPNAKFDLLPGGTNPNILKLMAGELDFIFATTSFMEKAHKGIRFVPELTSPVPQLLAITNLWDQYFTWTVRKDFPAESIDEVIRNKMKIRLCPGGPKGHTGVVAMEEYLDVVYGLKFSDLEAWGCKIIYAEFNDACQMIQDGQLDMFSPLTAAPAAAIMELATTTPVKFLTVDKATIEKLKPYGYVESMMSKTLYKGMSEDVKTLSLPYGIGVDAKMSDDLVYEMVKILCESEQYMKSSVAALAFFDPKKAVAEMGFPLHPGAGRYFKEKGWMK